MVEMMGLGVMAEIPAVIFVSQRGGPSTGMPTKTEQSDLNLAVFGGAGDAQRVVLAPTNVEGCYRCAGKAFEIAERCQTPVIVLMDLYLCQPLRNRRAAAKKPLCPAKSRLPAPRSTARRRPLPPLRNRRGRHTRPARSSRAGGRAARRHRAGARRVRQAQRSGPDAFADERQSVTRS